MKHKDFNWDDIILEAEEDDLSSDDELSATDYAEAEDMDIEEGEPSEDTGETEEMDEDPLDDSEGEESDDPLDEDPLSDEEGGESGDPLDEDPLSGDESSDENPEDEQTDNAENNVVSDKQNVNLANDFIELYRRIDEIMNQLRTDCKTNVRYNSNMLVARKNMEKLKEITFDYLTNKFAKESYVSNLYQFNLIIQALNVNIELVDSILATNRKIAENEKSKKKTKKPKKENKK